MIPVLLTTYNRLDYTKQAVHALQGTAALFIVDNHSTDGTVEWLRMNPLWAVYNEKNRGVAGAMNQFLEWCDKYHKGEDIVGKVDNDTLVDPHWVEHLVECMDRYGLDIVQAKHHIIPAVHPGGWDGFKKMLKPLGPGCYESKFVGGSAIIFRRSKVKELFDETGWVLGGWNKWQLDHPEVRKGFCEHTEAKLLDEHGYGDYPDYYKETGRLRA